MNPLKWKEEVLKLLQEMPPGKCFLAREISSQFNRFGPSPDSVGRFIRVSGLAVIDHDTHCMGKMWRRI